MSETISKVKELVDAARKLIHQETMTLLDADYDSDTARALAIGTVLDGLSDLCKYHD